ncbi:MAG: cold shock domain-containing protein [Kiloniellales bacterium]|jgi:CspA family cold shock protein
MTDDQAAAQMDITHREINAVVKWFNPVKGFGFVEPNDGSADAFLHISVIQRAGLRQLPQGATIICDLCGGQKGPQVATLHSVESMPEAPEPPPEGEATEVEGTVKFYNRAKGFGFVIPDDGTRDVFVSARVLELAGIENLGPDQRVRMMTREGQKGPMADSVETI